MSKFGLPCAFLIKMILIDFQLEKFSSLRKMIFTIFSCSIDVTMTSQMGHRLFTGVKELMCGSVIYTYNNRIFCCVEMVRKRLKKHKNENLI